MKTTTLHQPWATLVAIRAKEDETRSWDTKYRGPLLIHAAATVPAYAIQETVGNVFIQETLHNAGYRPKSAETLTLDNQHEYWRGVLNNLPLGCIVASSRLDDTRLMIAGDTPDWPRLAIGTVSARERAFGNWKPGRFAWRLKDVIALPQPIPARGFQRLWNWHDMTTPAKLPTIDEIDDLDTFGLATANPWNDLVMTAAMAAFDIVNPQVVLTWDLKQLETASDWMTWSYFAASDNAVRKARLAQPEHCKGVIQ